MGTPVRLGAWSALGIVAAVVITICANIMVARFYQRWDVTRGRLYTLSEPSLETIRGLSEHVEVLVFAGPSDPQIGAIRRLLGQYQAESRLIEVRYVDPDRNPAEFLALQNRYRLLEGRAEDGRLVSDALMLVVLGDARWVITADDVVAHDDEHGTVEPRLEQAITEGFRQVLSPKPVEVCISQGHGEPAVSDGGPAGLGGLRHTLEKNNYRTREVNFGEGATELGLSSCELVVIAAAEQLFDGAAVTRLTALARRGTSLLVSLGPALDEENRAASSGLEPLLHVFGVRPRGHLIFERDPDAVVPLGVGGEVYLATPKPHAVTQGLMIGSESRFRVLLQLSQAFESVAPAKPLLGTSTRSFGVANAAFLAAPGATLDQIPHDSDGPFDVAMASELEPPGDGSGSPRGARLVVMGSASPLLGHTWQDPALAGTRRFVESAVAWLASRPSLVSLPRKPGQRANLELTESAMTQVARYVLLYMPMTSLALGALILYRRRGRSPKASRGGAAA